MTAPTSGTLVRVLLRRFLDNDLLSRHWRSDVPEDATQRLGLNVPA